jgi:acyl-CoA reductase-like NAD-dependent aldehyde dehydrogenase
MGIPDAAPAAQYFKASNRQLLIDGQWQDAAEGRKFETLDPATGEVARDGGRGRRAGPRPRDGGRAAGAGGAAISTRPSATASFGGFRQSGWGREMGEEVLDAYTETKTVIVGL